MSHFIEDTIKKISTRVNAGDFDASLQFAIENEGSIRIDEHGVSNNDNEADCTLRCSSQTLTDLIHGNINPTMAVMSGKIKIEGDISVAMSLGKLL